jgi:hypothetical protein
MGWKHIYRDTAFCPYKDDLAAALELQDSLLVLRRFLDGQSGWYEVLDALRHLYYVCGQPVRGAIEQFRRCLFWESEDARNEMAKQCLAQIGGWINRNKSGATE